MRTHCIAQATLLIVVTQMGRKSEKEGIYMYKHLIYSAVQEKEA